MKKIALALLTVLGFTAANAQQDHSVLLYGNAGFTTTTTDTKENQMNWHVNPGVGYQFNKHWVLGAEMNWAQVSAKPNGGDRAANNTYSFGAFGRHVYNMGKSHFFCFTHFGAGYQGQFTKVGSASAIDKFNGYYASVTPNLGFMFGHGIAAYGSVGGLGYSSMKPVDASVANPDKNPTNTFSFTFGNNFSFGLSKNFGCHCMHKHHATANSEYHKAEKDDDDDSEKAEKKEKHRHHKKDKDDE